MNQGKIWTVVNPAVGLPLLLGSVAITALLVHLAILTHTTWFPAFMQGGLKKAASIEQIVG
ncbi:light-harvesting protein [Rhodoblastus acidophilus]|jgi:light-harvesting protein B-800-850 alpha chain|uniref:Antenna pigment protein alpha chain n=1 Tax=Rhodoblastus acidophilus TaxID=1074 RepID=A0A6N8DR99_RHOAC|nr:light-harvesting protein [Rhodoblastus acidophilus]MCW2274566.1 light-harvesting protein B-800-850 alpha chain [Rhodoblastus acidophilus]MTV32346.1 light-harvesting protein [Rhodoblastus acidophilus]